MSVFAGRRVAHLEGDFVVFLIGMRINRPWRPHKWLPVLTAMRPMIRELERDPDSGFLGAIYGNMPRVGLAAVGDHRPIGTTSATAARRIRLRPDDVAPVDGY